MSSREIDFFVLGRKFSAINAYVVFTVFKPELVERARQIHERVTTLCDSIVAGHVSNYYVIERFLAEFHKLILELRRENNRT
jgi:hypothetical protein